MTSDRWLKSDRELAVVLEEPSDELPLRHVVHEARYLPGTVQILLNIN